MTPQFIRDGMDVLYKFEAVFAKRFILEIVLHVELECALDDVDTHA